MLPVPAPPLETLFVQCGLRAKSRIASVNLARADDLYRLSIKLRAVDTDFLLSMVIGFLVITLLILICLSILIDRKARHRDWVVMAPSIVPSLTIGKALSL